MSETTKPTNLSGADILVQCLINHGVDVVFAYPGGASMPIHQALTRVSRPAAHHPAAPRAGRRLRGRGLRAQHRQGRRLHRHQRPRRHQLRHLPRRRQDGLRARSSPSPARSARPSSAPTPSRKRRSSRSAGPSPSITTWCSAPRTSRASSRRRSTSPRTGRPGPVIVDVPKDVQNSEIVVTDWDPPMNLPGYRPDRRATRPELREGRWT